jgi:conserved repeat domain
MRLKLFFLLIFPFSLVAQSWTPLDSVYINSGNPAFPFPQFLPYQNPTATLGNLATHSGVGVTHWEMEQTIRDAYRIMMNRASKPGGGVGGTDYVYFNSNPSCTEGDGYAMLAAAAMADKKTFDGLWLWIHDNAMNKVVSYSTGQAAPAYLYSTLPGWQNTKTTNSATDGDVDIALALFTAYKQWGEFMGTNDSKGNPISYKHDLVEFLKGMTDTLPFASNPAMLICGDIGMDGYIKGGDTWTEMTNWASNTAQSGFLKAPNYGGPQTEYIDYTAPAYFHEFAGFLSNESPALYAWNISQFQRCEASSDWIMGQLLTNPRMIPSAGHVALSAANVAMFTQMNEGEDFRLSWRTILNYVWHGNPPSVWDPAAHQPKSGTANTFERDIGLRYAKFLWDARQAPWSDQCTTVPNAAYTYWGTPVIKNQYDVLGNPLGTFFLNWVPGTGAPSAVASQDFNLMAQLYRQCEMTWDAEIPNDGYLTSVPKYYHGWFRLLGMLVLTGNYQPPSTFQPAANMKVYMAIDKTFGFEGDSVTYTIDYRNYGSQDAQGVSIVDTLHKDFVFLSATNGGLYSSAPNTVTWNIGTVPGFKTATGISPTKGQVVLKVKVGNTTQNQYRNRATVSCSNGSGWTSNEYPNDLSSVMKRNFLDIAKRALVVKNSVSIPNPKSGTSVQFTINFKNTSDAGWINGGRPGVHFAYSMDANTPSGASKVMRLRLFHDADEAYIDYGNYRFSYFLYDSLRKCYQGTTGCTLGWQVTPYVTEGLDKSYIKIFQENITPGQDSLGKWNQRIVVQFSDPTNPNRVINLAATDCLLQQYFGNLGTNIHRGGGSPLRLIWDLHTDYNNPQSVWNDDWSWDASAVDIEGGMYWPITNDWTDPNDTNIVVTTWNPHACSQASHTVKNVLIEEWDGYTWRRVAGNGPLPGRDVNNVVIRDTIPVGLSLNAQTVTTPPGFTQTINGNVITWTKPKMQVKDSGTITFTATASSSCPLRTKRLVNRAWISADKESPVADSAIVTLTCDSMNVITPTKSVITLKDPSSNIIPSGDMARIDTTAFFITVKDSDQNINNGARDTISAIVKNPSSGDSLMVKLAETGVVTGIFQSVSPVTVASQSGPNKISTAGGETVYITYSDQFDSTDISQAYLVTLSTFPVPVYGWLLDANGDGKADSAVVIYSKALTARPDSLLFYFPDQANFQTVKSGQGVIQQNGNIVTVSFAVPFATATTSFISGGTGSGFSFLTDGVTARKFQFPVADSIGPVITSAQVVERASGNTIDTLYATFSEAITPASLKGVSLVLVKNGVSTVITIDAVRTLISTRFALACAAGTPQPLAGDSLRINPAGPARDLYGNGAHSRNPAVVITLRQIPPTILKAYYVDRNAGRADGYVDTAFIQFNKKVSLGDLSFLLDWSNGLLVDNIRGDTISYIGTDSTRVGIALRTVFPYTGILRTSGAMNIIARFNDFPGESRQGTVADSAAPVIDSATYYVNTNTARACDTLVVVFSEPVTINQSLNPFRLSGKSASSYTFALTPIAFAGKIDTFCVSSASLPGVPQNGDTMWIAANNSVSDAGGVFQNNGNNRKVLVNVVQHKIDWKPFLACNPFTPGPGFICSAANGQPGTVITIKPINPLLALPHMTLRLQIFDVLGNFIFESPLAQKGADGNSYYFVWDGRNKNSRWVGSGVYRAVITVIDENGTSSKSITIGVKR